MAQITFLVYPFFACLALVLIHAYFGIHILQRGIIFVDIAMAQFIGVGIALSFYLGKENHYPFALLFAIIGSFVLSLSKKAEKFVNLEAFIGVLYVFSFAFSILILDKSPHGAEEFKSILNGNILWVTKSDVLYAYLLYFVIGLFHLMFREEFFSLTFEGKQNGFWEFLFFFTFGLVLVKSVVMAGVLTVFSFLIIPALIGRLFSKRFKPSLIIGYFAGTLATLISIYLSFKYDFPTSPLIVTIMSVFYFCALAIKILQAKEERV